MDKLIRNAARCRKCGDVIESKHRHDFVRCECGAIYIDGGLSYAQGGGDPSSFESLCEYKTERSTDNGGGTQEVDSVLICFGVRYKKLLN